MIYQWKQYFFYKLSLSHCVWQPPSAVSELALSAIDRGSEPRSGQTKDYKNGLCCFSAKHAALTREKKQRLSGWLGIRITCPSDVSIRGLLFQSASTIKIQLSSVGLVQSGTHHHLTEN